MIGDGVPGNQAAGSPARVLITVPCLELPGGVANYYRTLRPHLDAGKVYFEIGVRPGQAGRWTKVRRLLADYWRFNRALARGQIDLVHLNPSMDHRCVLRDGLLMLIAKAHGRTVLVFFRGWDPVFEATIRTRYARLFRLVYGRVDAFVVLAEEFRHSLRALGLSAPITVETTVVADSVFNEAIPAGVGRDRQSSVCRLLYLGRLDRGKGLREAIESVARLAGLIPSVALTVAGDGPERTAGEEWVAARGLTGVRFVGHIEGAEKARAFAEADIYLFTSPAEGMPNSVLEAMAFGLPVVTSAVGGIRDFFEDGRMGYVTESRDPAVFAELLARLARDPALRASIGRYNRNYARGRFAASVVATRLLEIYAQTGRQAADD